MYTLVEGRNIHKMTGDELESLLQFLKHKRSRVDEDIERILRKISNTERDTGFVTGVEMVRSGILGDNR